jgi:hypothetical protein
VRVWSAASADGASRYLAVFNMGKDPREIAVPLATVGAGAKAMVRDLWERRDLGPVQGRLVTRLAPHASALYRLA